MTRKTKKKADPMLRTPRLRRRFGHCGDWLAEFKGPPRFCENFLDKLFDLEGYKGAIYLEAYKRPRLGTVQVKLVPDWAGMRWFSGKWSDLWVLQDTTEWILRTLGLEKPKIMVLHVLCVREDT